MKGWMRYLCPSYIGIGYGNWCGAKRTADEWHGKSIKDDGDAACRIHDFGLRNAVDDEAKKKMDVFLYQSWKDFKPKTLYGKIYRRALLIAFKPKGR